MAHNKFLNDLLLFIIYSTSNFFYNISNNANNVMFIIYKAVSYLHMYCAS